jgi:hypothetical protein
MFAITLALKSASPDVCMSQYKAGNLVTGDVMIIALLIIQKAKRLMLKQ